MCVLCIIFMCVCSCFTSNKNFILDVGMEKTIIGMEGICITHSCIPLYCVHVTHNYITHSGGMQEWVIQKKLCACLCFACV